MMNVIDDYKMLDPATIRGLNAQSSHHAAIALHNVEGGLNLGSMVRTANFLGFSEVLYYGRRKYNKRSAVGTYHYTYIHHYETEQEFLEAIRSKSYRPVAMENNVNYQTTPLWGFTWPDHPCIIVGEEGHGLSDDILDQCEAIVEVPGLGSARCLNVSVTAGIAMADYIKTR